MFITVRDYNGFKIINLTMVSFIYTEGKRIYIEGDNYNPLLSYNSEEEAEEAIKEISLLIEEKQ